jgi:hypothetical protein
VAAGHRALVGSIVAHAAALAAIAGWMGDGAAGRAAARHAEERATIPIEVLPPAPAPAPVPPIDVALLPGDAHEPAAASSRPTGDEPRRTRIVSGAGAATPAEPGRAPGRGEPRPGQPGALAMRGLRHDLSLSGEALARALQDRPLPAPVTPSGRIEPRGGEARIDDATASYRIRGDGTVEVQNKDDIDIHWRIHLPTPSRIRDTLHAAGDDIAAWRADPYRDTRVGTTQDLPRHLQSTPDSCQRFGDPMCDANPQHRVAQPAEGGGGIIPVLAGRLDITGYLQRKLTGSDPYAARKQKLLDLTRAERVERGAAHRAAQLDRSAELIAKNLEALWRTTADPAARREALFQLWDECAEGEGEGAAGAAGARARAMVIGWITAHLPAGSPDAFTADDIARLDARRSSKQHFAPYPAR